MDIRIDELSADDFKEWLMTQPADNCGMSRDPYRYPLARYLSEKFGQDVYLCGEDNGIYIDYAIIGDESFELPLWAMYFSTERIRNVRV
jgi:hypothetical protein